VPPVARASRIGILLLTLIGGAAACGSDPATTPDRDSGTDAFTGATPGSDGADAGSDTGVDATPLQILQAQSPDETCRLSEESSGIARRLQGILDLGLDRAYEYRLYPLIANRVWETAPDAGANAPDPGSLAITVTEAAFEVQPPPGLGISWPPECPPVFVEPLTMTLPPGRQAVTSLTAIRTCHAAVLRDLFRTGKLDRSLTTRISVRVVLRVRGQLGGAAIESAAFEFPIRICDGCLQTGFAGPYAEFSRALDPPKTPACDHLVENPYRGNPCNPAQDIGPILCCTTTVQGTEKLLCPGVPMSSRTP
jgi:hypothetical protein